MKMSQLVSGVLLGSTLLNSGCQRAIEREFIVNIPLGEHVVLNGTKIEVEVAPGGDVECEVESPNGQEYEQTFNLNSQVPGTRIVYNNYLFEFEREKSELEIDIQRVGQPNTEFWEQNLDVSQFLTGFSSSDDDDSGYDRDD